MLAGQVGNGGCSEVEDRLIEANQRLANVLKDTQKHRGVKSSRKGGHTIDSTLGKTLNIAYILFNILGIIISIYIALYYALFLKALLHKNK